MYTCFKNFKLYYHSPSTNPSISYKKMIAIQYSIETDRTTIYMLDLSITRNLHRPKENYRMHKITRMMSDSDLVVSFS